VSQYDRTQAGFLNWDGMSMIDRNARDRMAATLRSYMGEKITAFELDESLGKVMTEDRTARKVRLWLWFHYDDLKDHKVVASKAQWDYFNRLLLLLASNAEIEINRTWRGWHMSQVPAGLCVACLAFIVLRTGVGYHLIIYALPFSFLSLVIGRFNRRRMAKLRPEDDSLIPFQSFSDLRAIRRGVPGFIKARYPEGLVGREIRPNRDQKWFRVYEIILWLVFGPLALLLQTLPDAEAVITVRTAQP
jgi:hypothetical protein